MSRSTAERYVTLQGAPRAPAAEVGVQGRERGVEALDDKARLALAERHAHQLGMVTKFSAALKIPKTLSRKPTIAYFLCCPTS